MNSKFFEENKSDKIEENNSENNKLGVFLPD
jgi:hypothetical protein